MPATHIAEVAVSGFSLSVHVYANTNVSETVATANVTDPRVAWNATSLIRLLSSLGWVVMHTSRPGPTHWRFEVRRRTD